MVKLKRTSQLRCLTWLLVLLLLLQQNQRVAASAGNGDGGSRGGGALPAKDANVQEAQLHVDDPAVAKGEPLPSQRSLGHDERHFVLDEDSGGETVRVELGSGRAKVIRRVALGVGLVATLLVLAVGAYVSMVQAEMVFTASTSNLRRLQALMPTAQKLFITVDTPKSARLWTAVKELLPELTKTLDAAEAKSKESRFFSVGLLTGEYSDLLRRVDGTVEKVSQAVAALHKEAREELNVIAERITEITSPQLWQLRDQVKAVLGFSIAEPYVNFVLLQESRGQNISHTVREVLERSNRRPVFESGMDEALLLITQEDVAQLKRMFIARDDALTRIVNATTSCTHAFASTMRAEIMAAEQQHRVLVTGLSFFFQQSELPSDVKQRLRANFEKAMLILNEDFPSLLGSISADVSIEGLSGIYKTYKEKLDTLTKLTALAENQVLLEGQGDERSQLQTSLAVLMKGAAAHAGMIVQQVHTLADHIKQKVDEASKESVFLGTLKDFAALAQKYSENAKDAATSCRKLADQLESGEEIGNLFEIFMKGVEGSSRASNRYKLLVALQGGLDLLQIYDADVMSSLAIMESLDVDSADVDSARARELVSLKDEVLTLQALAGNAPYLLKASTAAIDLRKAADAAAFERYELAVAKLEEEHKKANLKTWESANHKSLDI
ncbi:hypothetical protein Emag_005509 [Eimeria magna]